MKKCKWLLLCVCVCFALLLSVGAAAADETLPVPSKPYCGHGTDISGQQGVYLEVSPISGIEGYIFYRSTDGVSYTEAGTSGFSMYIDTGVEGGVTYYYKVACYFDGSVGEASEPTVYTFVRCPERPVLQPITLADGHPVLTWTASDAKEGDTYNVYRGETEDEFFKIAEVTELTYTDTQNLSDGAYYYMVSAVREGVESAHSRTRSVVLFSVPPTGDANGDGSISLADVLCVLRYSSDNSFSIDKQHADFNRDGNIDLADALSILRFVLSQ